MSRFRAALSRWSLARLPAATKLVCVALFLFLTGGPAVIAQFDDSGGNARFWLQERERAVRAQQRARPIIVQRPTHLIRKAAPRKGFAVEVQQPAPQPMLNPDGTPVIGPDGQPVMIQPAAPAEGTNVAAPAAPAEPAVAQKPAEPTFFVAVIGDNIGQLLAQGLQEAFADQPDIAILRRTRETSGLVRDDFFDWQKGARDLLAGSDRINVAVMMIGSNDRQPLRENGVTLEPRSPRWNEIYASRIEAIAGLFKARNIPLIWVGMPVMKNERLSADLVGFNELYRDAAQKAGATYVDVWDAFTDDRGQFSLYGPDVNGQIARLRTGDGVHFTKAGARKLAHFVESEIRHAYEDAHPKETPAIAALEAPAGPDAKAPPGSPDKQIAALPPAAETPSVPAPPVVPPAPPRPLAGPVAALTNAFLSPGGVLATRHKPDAGSRRLVDRVLVQGAIPAPQPGRADDFSWPRL
jgi:hypothetical protein